MLEARAAELQEIAVRAYTDTDEYRFYVEDGEVCRLCVSNALYLVERG